MGTPRVVVGCVRSCDARLHHGDHRPRVADAMSTACSPSRSQACRPLYVFFPWVFGAVLWAATAVVTTDFCLWTPARMVAALGVTEWKLISPDSSSFLPNIIAVPAPPAWSCHGRILTRYSDCEDGQGLALPYGSRILVRSTHSREPPALGVVSAL